MKTPNLFKRDGSVVTWGFADEAQETLDYYDKTDFNRLDVKIGDKFTDIDNNGDEFQNVRITLSVGNITKASFKACPLFIGTGNSANKTYDLQTVLDFFLLP